MKTVTVGGRVTGCVGVSWGDIGPGRVGGACSFGPESFAHEAARRALLRPMHFRREFMPLRAGVKSFVDLLRRKVHPNTMMNWIYAVELFALRAVAPRRADSDSGRPLCAG